VELSQRLHPGFLSPINKLKTSVGKPYSLNLPETVAFYLNKPKFGIENYSPRNANLNLVEPKAFR
jgi:hypothetical protein